MYIKSTDECYDCAHKRSIAGDCHIQCVNPSLDVLETGVAHGVKNGWFGYPFNFSPTWKSVECENFKQK